MKKNLPTGGTAVVPRTRKTKSRRPKTLRFRKIPRGQSFHEFALAGLKDVPDLHDKFRVREMPRVDETYFDEIRALGLKDIPETDAARFHIDERGPGDEVAFDDVAGPLQLGMKRTAPRMGASYSSGPSQLCAFAMRSSPVSVDSKGAISM